MRRVLVLSLAVIALMGMIAPSSYAQATAAPAPTFKITGLIDTVTNVNKNLQNANYTRDGDKEWYSRNRTRFSITGQVGKAIGVIGFEIDTAWGQVSASDTNTTTTAAGTAQRIATTSAFDLNTDTQGSLELKSLYVEYDVPLIPFPTRMRIGAQPFTATYKYGVLASGDFAGVNVDTTFAPNVKTHFTYVQIEEELTGGGTGGGTVPGATTTFVRGDDFAIIASVEVTPIRGLDLRPTYALLWAQGATSTSARSTAGGIPGAGGTPTFVAKPIGNTGTGVAGHTATHEEWRHTIGIDSRWRSGPISIEPTFFYQFGTREIDNPFGTPGSNAIRESDISAWFFDLIAGYRVGPVLLEGRYVYTSGNRPRDQLSRDTNYYQPIDADSSYGLGWGNITALGIDYNNGNIRTMGSGIGLDRYGRQQFALRGTYSVSPTLDIYGLVTPLWTARSVDTDGTQVPGILFVGSPTNCSSHSANSAAQPRGAGCRGDSSYIGTEANIGTTWRFAPGLTFDLVYGYLFAGDALDSSEVLNGVLTRRDAQDIYTGTARVRFTF
ncbi:MAG: hypothetical protein HYV93_03170 [Candidatus Rokubacteria bacterium]|nr:hypothetical protein [Candidatus Rokubacteria bacterium]